MNLYNINIQNQLPSKILNNMRKEKFYNFIKDSEYKNEIDKSKREREIIEEKKLLLNLENEINDINKTINSLNLLIDREGQTIDENWILKILNFITFDEIKKSKCANLFKKLKNLNLELQKLNQDSQKQKQKIFDLNKDLEVSIQKNLQMTKQEIQSLLKKLESEEFIENFKKFKDFEIVLLLNKNINLLKNLEEYPNFSLEEQIKKISSTLKEKYSGFELKNNISEWDELFQNIKFLSKNLNSLKDKYIEFQLDKNMEFFNNIDGKKLDKQQRIAVVTDEDNNLVVAGAGSGKTLTISAKVKYLVEKHGISPKDILLLSFTRKAAKEMTERISKKLNIDIESKTFHVLGNNIISYFTPYKKSVFDAANTNFKKHFIENYVARDENLASDILKYSSIYSNDYIDPNDKNQFENIGDFYRFNKSLLFRTLDSKFECVGDSEFTNEFYKWKYFIDTEKNLEKIILKTKKILKTIEVTANKLGMENSYNSDVFALEKLKKNITDFYNSIIPLYSEKLENSQLLLNEAIEKLYKNKISISKYHVKSIEELIIANYLYLNGVKFEYEKKYEYKTSDKNYRQYKPDFYLIDGKVYLEHFGIDENNKCPQFSQLEEARYLEGIEWKRKLHRENNTILEETYSYEHKNGNLIKKLDSILEKYGIEKKELSKEELIDLIFKLSSDYEYGYLYKLLDVFLNLFKANNYSERNLEEFIKNESLKADGYQKTKHLLFLNIFKKYYEVYQDFLHSNDEIDFNDMINLATDFINKNELPENFKYKYIIIDEFQDISISRYKLINSIRKKAHSKIMAVGDDWQSIFKFAGNDLDIFTNFEEYFGKTELMKIEKTYRNSQNLIDVAGSFIMSNETQIKKDLQSTTRNINQPISMIQYADEDQLKNTIVKLILKLTEKNPDKKIMFLGRNNRDLKVFEDEFLFKLSKKENYTQIRSKLFPKEADVIFMTVHSAKGLEADEVVVLNNKNDLLGFPTMIEDDSILDYVSKSDNNYLYAEERRLFYVAITRTKNTTYLLYPTNYSLFIRELKSYKNEHIFEQVIENQDSISCPKCKGGNLVLKTNGSNGNKFYGCSNYPQCNFTINSNRISPVRCPKCGGFMVKRKGKYGEFYGCSNYNGSEITGCSFTYSLEDVIKLKKK